MKFRDRIKELRRVPAGQLRPHPRNWRTHPPAQRNAMQGVLREIGYADALLARELDDGSLQLVDGHLRAEVTPEALVPVLVLDVDEQEALALLATHDPLAGMAGADEELLRALIADVETDEGDVRALLNKLQADHDDLDTHVADATGDVIMPSLFQVVVECQDEYEQRGLFERLAAEGFKCRAMVL